jgi:hypothetical protein
MENEEWERQGRGRKCTFQVIHLRIYKCESFILRLSCSFLQEILEVAQALIRKISTIESNSFLLLLIISFLLI